MSRIAGDSLGDMSKTQRALDSYSDNAMPGLSSQAVTAGLLGLPVGVRCLQTPRLPQKSHAELQTNIFPAKRHDTRLAAIPGAVASQQSRAMI
ncbi:hypothetical protein DH86_00002351 [Scytalidium sp. 3C]|nr:hypothetical protein DH86_00002351 [Scytalidium sp. 3C]